MIKKIKVRLVATNQRYLIYNDKKDIEALREVVNLLIVKVNELIDAVNKEETKK